MAWMGLAMWCGCLMNRKIANLIIFLWCALENRIRGNRLAQKLREKSSLNSIELGKMLIWRELQGIVRGTNHRAHVEYCGRCPSPRGQSQRYKRRKRNPSIEKKIRTKNLPFFQTTKIAIQTRKISKAQSVERLEMANSMMRRHHQLGRLCKDPLTFARPICLSGLREISGRGTSSCGLTYRESAYFCQKSYAEATTSKS